MSLTFEKSYPWFLALAAAVLAWMLGLGFPVEGRNDVLSAGISISSIFAGFLATSKAILMAMPSTGLMRELKDSTTYIDNLADYLRDGLIGSLVFAMVGLGGYFHVGANGIFFAIWFGLAVLSLATFWRVSNIMVGLIKR